MDNTQKNSKISFCKRKKNMTELKEQGSTNKYICGKFGRAKSVVSDVLIYSRKLGMSLSFKASDGWFSKFKSSHDLKYKKICGEASLVNQSVVTEFQANLPTLLNEYHPDNIYNFDEFAFFSCNADSFKFGWITVLLTLR